MGSWKKVECDPQVGSSLWTTVISPRLGNKGRWAEHPWHMPTSMWLSCRVSGYSSESSAQCGPVLWLLRTYQSQLRRFWLLITMERKLIWIFLNMTRVFFFTLVSCCSISSLSLVVSPFYEPNIMWESLCLLLRVSFSMARKWSVQLYVQQLTRTWE